MMHAAQDSFEQGSIAARRGRERGVVRELRLDQQAQPGGAVG